MDWQNLDGRLSPHDVVNCFEDLPHTALPDEIRDQVRSKIQLVSSRQHLIGLIPCYHGGIDESVSQGLFRYFTAAVFDENVFAQFSFCNVKLSLCHEAA